MPKRVMDEDELLAAEWDDLRFREEFDETVSELMMANYEAENLMEYLQYLNYIFYIKYIKI